MDDDEMDPEMDDDEMDPEMDDDDEIAHADDEMDDHDADDVDEIAAAADGVDEIATAADDDVADEEVLPLPPSPAISDITYESDTSDALGHALETEVRSTFEVGESSTRPRVSPAELRAELSRLRDDISWCRGRYVSMSRRLCERQSDVKGLRREVKRDRRDIGDVYVTLDEHASRLTDLEKAAVEFREKLESFEKRMKEIEKLLEQVDSDSS